MVVVVVVVVVVVILVVERSAAVCYILDKTRQDKARQGKVYVC